MKASHEPNHQDVIKALMVMATIYEKALTEDAADMLVSDLSEYGPDKILKALKLCRLELNRFPTVAEIIKRTNPKSEANQTQEIVGKIFEAISWYGYSNPSGAKKMIGEVGWKAVEFFGGWQRLCDAPADDLNITRSQLRKAVESAVEEKVRCDVLGVPFVPTLSTSAIGLSSKRPELRLANFSDFLPKGPA
jgi:hypothetical protein